MSVWDNRRGSRAFKEFRSAYQLARSSNDQEQEEEPLQAPSIGDVAEQNVFIKREETRRRRRYADLPRNLRCKRCGTMKIGSREWDVTRLICLSCSKATWDPDAELTPFVTEFPRWVFVRRIAVRLVGDCRGDEILRTEKIDGQRVWTMDGLNYAMRRMGWGSTRLASLLYRRAHMNEREHNDLVRKLTKPVVDHCIQICDPVWIIDGDALWSTIQRLGIPRKVISAVFGLRYTSLRYWCEGGEHRLQESTVDRLVSAVQHYAEVQGYKIQQLDGPDPNV